MTTDDPARRTSGWETMHANLAADAVLADAALYASGGRRLTVEHGQALTPQAEGLLRQLVDQVDAAAAAAQAGGHDGGGTVTIRATSITCTFPTEFFPDLPDERGPGRPEIGPAVQVRLPEELLGRVDKHARRHGTSRAGAVRALLDLALAGESS